MSCTACTKVIKLNELLKCVACKDVYHFMCLNMTAEDYQANNVNWQCESCLNVTRRSRRCDNTPVRAQHGLKPSPLADSSAKAPPVVQPAASMPEHDTLLDRFAGLLDEKLDEKLDKMRKSMAGEIKRELWAFIDNLKSEFTHTTDHLSGQIGDLSERVRKVESQNASLHAELAALKGQPNAIVGTSSKLNDVIANLQMELNEREQSTLLNDVEISGVPELPGESVLSIVAAVSTKLGVELDHRDIVSATRAGPVRRETGGGPRPRPRPIAVRLVRRALRDDLLRSARVRRGATTADIGLPSHDPRPLYVNERLSSTNRAIFGKAREMGRALNWRFVWSKEGRIYARRDDSPASRAHRLRVLEDLDRVFGPRPDVSKE